MSLSWYLSDDFLLFRLGLWGFERKTIGIKWYFYISAWLIIVDHGLDHLAEVVLVRFLYCKITALPPFHMCSLKELTTCSSHLRSGSLDSTSWSVEYLHKLLEIILHRKFISFSLFICSFNYPFITVLIHGYLFYTLDIIHYYFIYFVIQIVTALAIVSFICWLLWHSPTTVGLFIHLEHFLIFWYSKITCPHFVYFLP